MLKLLSLSAVAAFTVVNLANAQVAAPREVKQEQGAGTQIREAQTRAGNAVNDQTGVQNRAARPAPVQGSTPADPIPNGNDPAVRSRETRRQIRAEERQERAAERSEVAHSEIDHATHLQRHLAECFMLHNQSEINLAKFALDHSENAKVKEFAQVLIKDHEKFAATLTPFLQTNETAPAPASTTTTVPATTTREAIREKAAEAAPAVVERVSNGRVDVKLGYRGQNHFHDQMYQIEKEATEKCEVMARNLLSDQKGANFDKCFIGMEVGSHIGMLSYLQAAEAHTTGDFQKVLQNQAEMVSKHYEHAMSLHHELVGMHAEK